MPDKTPESFNPYACPEQHLRDEKWRIPWTSLGMSVAAVSLIVAAGSRFLAVALDTHGLLGGVLLAGIGAVVGRVIGTQPRARGMTMLAAGLMFLGLVNGWVDHEGEEPILWAFACMCGGLLFGTAYPHSSDEVDGDQGARVRGVIAEGVDGEVRRN
jgi:hypothetical protein